MTAAALEMISRLANSFFTVTLGLVLTYLYYARRDVRFTSLLSWSTGFILYGFQIMLRIWYPWGSVEVFILSIFMSLLLILGTSNLIRWNKVYGAVYAPIMIIAILLFPSGSWYRFGAFAFFGLMTIAVIHLRLIIGRTADRLIAGWLILFLANVIFVATFRLEWIADLVAIPAKGILAVGMLDQRFTQIILEIRKTYKSLAMTVKPFRLIQ